MTSRARRWLVCGFVGAALLGGTSAVVWWRTQGHPPVVTPVGTGVETDTGLSRAEQEERMRIIGYVQ